MLGVCYYPEHWPEQKWPQDAEKMRELGLEYVRIGEFSWSRLEPSGGEYDFAWLDRAIAVLHEAGLKVILGTPTATPPKWLIDKYPDIVAVDPVSGLKRGFGSRRHYDFSSPDYLREALRITELMAERYAHHPAIYAWQTDNELSCHDTTLSGSDTAKQGFQQWCEQQYFAIDTLNAAWGNVFWSMEYNDFEQIELPLYAVTETNPSHQLAWRRYSSDQVVAFHCQMIACIKGADPDTPVTHNFIPTPDTQADNYALAEDLDFVSYDNYPLGRSDLFFAEEGHQQFARYMRTGHPDFAAFYHDQTRALSSGEYWIMEQQPGPVNWAWHNPRPAPGMVRLWSLEAIAHGADKVCFFRWRQASFAQEQMHAGLLRNDDSKSAAWGEIEQLQQDLDCIKPLLQRKRSPVAIVNHVSAQWVTEIEQQGKGYDYFRVLFDYYHALRGLALDVDFISPDADLDGYKLVVVPCLPIVSKEFVGKCRQSDAVVLFGPRSGSKTEEFQLPDNLPPGVIQSELAVKVLSVETLREDICEPLHYRGGCFTSRMWREQLSTDNCEVLASYEDGSAALVRDNNLLYLGTLTNLALLTALFTDLATEQGLVVTHLPEGLRIARRGELTFVFNYLEQSQQLDLSAHARLLVGSVDIGGRDLAIWQSH